MPSSPWQIVGRVATLRTDSLTATVDPDDPAAGLRIESLCGCAVVGATLFGVQIERVQIERSGRANETLPTATPPVDCFVRGNDFVATYAETADRPYRAQIYWRLIDGDRSVSERSAGGHRADPIAALELIVSVQTSRLDSEPALAVCTTLGAVEAWRLLDAADDCGAANGDTSHAAIPGRATVVPGFHASDSPGCCLIRPIGSGPSYLEMVHPADFRQTTFEWTADSSPIVRLAHRLFAERLEKGVILRSRIRGLFVPRARDTERARTEYRRFAASEPPLTA
jgi:hypothetical protein